MKISFIQGRLYKNKNAPDMSIMVVSEPKQDEDDKSWSMLVMYCDRSGKSWLSSSTDKVRIEEKDINNWEFLNGSNK
jgi:hypothetical protein